MEFQSGGLQPKDQAGDETMPLLADHDYVGHGRSKLPDSSNILDVRRKETDRQQKQQPVDTSMYPSETNHDKRFSGNSITPSELDSLYIPDISLSPQTDEKIAPPDSYPITSDYVMSVDGGKQHELVSDHAHADDHVVREENEDAHAAEGTARIMDECWPINGNINQNSNGPGVTQTVHVNIHLHTPPVPHRGSKAENTSNDDDNDDVDDDGDDE